MVRPPARRPTPGPTDPTDQATDPILRVSAGRSAHAPQATDNLPATSVRSPFASAWVLDPAVTFLNHGSFGACPRDVLAAQQAMRARLEAQPVQFLARDLEIELDGARARLAAFLGVNADDLAFVPNATAGVNTVLRSLHFAPGDELLTTDHEYNASVNALRYVADRDRAHVVVARIPFPIDAPGTALAAILERVTPRTRLVLLSHVTSPTALILPLDELVPELRRRGIETLVDGAHGPGMLPLDLAGLGAAYYTGNLHKWCCAPKGAAFLHVRPDLREQIRPLAISHGANSTRTDRPRFRLEFDWTGTPDPTAYLCAPVALDSLGAMVPGGWPEIMAVNHRLALGGRDAICTALRIPPPAPNEMLGSMATIPLPQGDTSDETLSPLDENPLQVALRERFGIEVPVLRWPPLWAQGPGVESRHVRRLVRISAHLYNDAAQYDLLATALTHLLREQPAAR